VKLFAAWQAAKIEPGKERDALAASLLAVDANKAVSVYGSRYGPPKAPATRFDVALCDTEIKSISQWQFPYSTFPYGDAQWVRIEVPPTRVPDEFAICLNFRPVATSGVFVHWDSSRNGASLVATPGKPGNQLEQGEWMMRIELDQAKEADALTR
jgi:hypothetical protein